jgi:hypothetical protein
MSGRATALDGQSRVGNGYYYLRLAEGAKDLRAWLRRRRVEAGGQPLSEREEPQLVEVSIDPGETIRLLWLHGQHCPHDGEAGRPHDGDADQTNDKALHAFAVEDGERDRC